MKVSAATVMAFAAGAIGAPSSHIPRQSAGACGSQVTLDASTNVFSSYTLHANSFYRSEVEAAVGQMSGADAEAAAKVADVGTFLWLDSIENISRLPEALKDMKCEDIMGVVVYDLPGRDCNALASNGELATGQLDRYKSEYVDAIAAIIKANPNTAFALIIEPDSLPNLVTNISNPKCSAAASDYRDGVAYALQTLNLPNVVMYVDAGHGGWLGWDDKTQPGAQEIANAYKAAGSPKQFRGFSTNVSGWNQWDMTPGEFANHGDDKYNKAENEKKYIAMMGADLASAGAPNHAITDTGRTGQSGGRIEWGDWCNVVNAGFGRRPSADTGDDLTDAFVWVKPGGESDGTSDSSAQRFDGFCGKADAFQPSPEAGTWHQAYFEMLVKNANPAF